MNKRNVYNIEINSIILNYIITGLEIYCIMINNLNYSSCLEFIDLDEKNTQYADIFYTYHYLISLSDDFKSRFRLQKPNYNVSKKSKVLEFLNKVNVV